MSTENISRRDLIKLMVMASSAICQPITLFAYVIPSPSAAGTPNTDRPLGHPRLFFNATSLNHLQQVFSTDTAAADSLKKFGEELMAASPIPETAAIHGEGQHAS